MRKINAIVALCAMFALLSCSQTSKSFVINGSVSGVEDGTIVEIIPTATHQDEKPVVAGEIMDGKFTLKGSVEEPIAVLMHIGDNGYHTFMLENANIDVVAEIGEGGYYKSVEVAGSPYTELFKEKIAFRDSLDVIHEAFNAEYSKALAAAAQEKDPKKAEQMRMDARAEMERASHEFFNNVDAIMMRNFRANGEDFWGPLLVLYNMNYFNEGDTTFINLFERDFSEKARNSRYGQFLKKQLFPSTVVGGPLPDMYGLDKNGVKQSLKELCAGKKYVIIDFWASWCGPCRKSIPALKEFYAKYAPKGVEIVGISIDKREADWKKALEQEQLPWPNIIDNESVNSTLFYVRAVPTMFVVNSEGVVVSNNFYDPEERAKWCETFDKL